MKILYLSGRGGELHSGLGKHLQSLASEFGGIGFNDATLSHSFGEQVGAVKELITHYACRDTYLIANSYGCYVLLHALIGAPSLPSKTLMLSPLLGRVHLRSEGFSSRPPRLRALNQALAQHTIQKPAYLSMVAGDQDPICEPAELRDVADLLGADHCELLQHQGHMIEHDVMDTVLSEFFAKQQTTL